MKNKVNISISEKDKMILIILFIGLIVFCSYYFGYRNINAMTLEVKQEKEELTAKYKTLYPLYQKKDSYASEAKKLQEKSEKLLSQFPNGMNQEGLILLAKSIEEKNDVWFSSMAMSEITPAYTFGKVVSTNPTRKGQPVWTTDMVGHKSVLTFSYQVSYEKFKEMLEYFNTNEEDRLSVENVSMTYDEGEDRVSGTLNLAVYDITGKDREYAGLGVYDVPMGTSNIFRSRMSAIASVSNIVNDYDAYVSVLPYKEGEASTIIGLNKDALNKTAISSEVNAVQTVTMIINGSNNKYTISYKVGDKMYPAENYFEGAEFDCGDSIDLLVLSAAREAAEDKSAVKLNIANSSDKTVNLFVYGDDEKNPRVSLGTVTGQVNVEN